MRLTALSAFVLAALAASAVHADEPDDRYGCMAADGRVKLAVRVEFSDYLGGKLSHLTGRLSVLDPAAPEGIRERRLFSRMVSQSWSDREQVLVQIRDSETEPQVLGVKLVAAAGSFRDGRMLGHYEISRTDEKGPGFHVEGALFCQRHLEKVALLQDESEVE